MLLSGEVTTTLEIFFAFNKLSIAQNTNGFPFNFFKT